MAEKEVHLPELRALVIDDHATLSIANCSTGFKNEYKSFKYTAFKTMIKLIFMLFLYDIKRKNLHLYLYDTQSVDLLLN
jgi:hypothetical protein